MRQSSPLIAVLDDEPKLRHALQRLLVSHGFQVETYAKAADFFAALPSHPAECLILDWQMPLMNGFEVQNRLAQTHPALPVVIITGHDSDETRQQALAGRPVAYLRKPVDEQTLLDAIEQALQSTPATKTRENQ